MLVHCKMGVSRSSSTVIAYVMKQQRWAMDVAMAYVRDRRSIIKPNDGFLKQLQTYNGILNARLRHTVRTFNVQRSIFQDVFCIVLVLELVFGCL